MNNYNDERCGWAGDFTEFSNTKVSTIVNTLKDKSLQWHGEASTSQVKAWEESICLLQKEVQKILKAQPECKKACVIFEYILLNETRRIDAILLVNGNVIVLEFKSKSKVQDKDIEQVQAYARDLYYFHEDCHYRKLIAVLVLTKLEKQGWRRRDDVLIMNAGEINRLVSEIHNLSLSHFLRDDAYRPLPSLLPALREIFLNKDKIPRIHFAADGTNQAYDEIIKIIRTTQANKRRSLIFLTGVPGSGKTYVGLRVVFSEELGKFVDHDNNGLPLHPPAVYLASALSEFFQKLFDHHYSAGTGKTIFKQIKNFKHNNIVQEHIFVFDEAQRTYDKHKNQASTLLKQAEKINDWSVFIALYGDGQSINKDEKGGIELWNTALQCKKNWDVYGPSNLASNLTNVKLKQNDVLHLDTNLRTNHNSYTNEFFREILNLPTPMLALENKDKNFLELIPAMKNKGYNLFITRNLELAKQHLIDHYSTRPEVLYGLLATSSSKEEDKKDLGNRTKDNFLFLVQTNKKESHCTKLKTYANEFDIIGLEMEAAIICWGTDFIIEKGKWSESLAKIKNLTLQIYANKYRVLLTRTREITIIYIPQLSKLQETYEMLSKAGISELPEKK